MAAYSPSALTAFAKHLAPGPQSAEAISIERFRHRLNIHRDHHVDQDTFARVSGLHRHFCTKAYDRELAAYDSMNDIRDAVTGASRLADVMFVGFFIRPNHQELRGELTADKIDIQAIVSPQVKQNPAYVQAVERIQSLVIEDLAMPHVKSFISRLGQVTDIGRYTVSHSQARNPASGTSRSPRIVSNRDQTCLASLQTPTRTVRSQLGEGVINTASHSEPRLRHTTTSNDVHPSDISEAEPREATMAPTSGSNAYSTSSNDSTTISENVTMTRPSTSTTHMSQQTGSQHITSHARVIRLRAIIEALQDAENSIQTGSIPEMPRNAPITASSTDATIMSSAIPDSPISTTIDLSSDVEAESDSSSSVIVVAPPVRLPSSPRRLRRFVECSTVSRRMESSPFTSNNAGTSTSATSASASAIRSQQSPSIEDNRYSTSRPYQDSSSSAPPDTSIIYATPPPTYDQTMFAVAQRYGLAPLVADYLTEHSYISPEMIQYISSVLDAPPGEWEDLLEHAGLAAQDAHSLVGILLELL